ncbi:hypothetical protein KY386_01655 [Candidatus Parcubacteria bacterium]|nr:hypothetical protein [Candidatus Parcubacteria bacterium]
MRQKTALVVALVGESEATLMKRWWHSVFLVCVGVMAWFAYQALTVSWFAPELLPLQRLFGGSLFGLTALICLGLFATRERFVRKTKESDAEWWRFN